MNLTSGFSYNTFGENVDYSFTKYQQYDSSISITTDSIISMNFDTINNVLFINYYQYDSIVHNLDSAENKLSAKNRFSYLTIPFLIGYNLNYKKLDFNLRVGISYSYLLSKKGQYINYQLLDFENALPKKHLFNYILSPTLSYAVSKNIGLVINPQIIINAKSILPQKEIKQRYKNYGVLLGISYHFKEKNSPEK